MKTGLVFIGTVLGVCLGLPSVLEAAESAWSSKAPLPTARFGLTTCVVDGRIYTLGGGDAPYTPYLPDVEIYDPATDSWETGIPMPNSRMGHAAVVVGGKIYVMGEAYGALTSTATVDEFDPATGTWATRARMPNDRVFHCAGAVDGKIYVLGGCGSGWNVNGADVTDVDVYDPASNTWTRKGKMRFPRAMAAAAVVTGRIYVFGGIVGSLANSPVSTAGRGSCRSWMGRWVGSGVISSRRLAARGRSRQPMKGRCTAFVHVCPELRPSLLHCCIKLNRTASGPPEGLMQPCLCLALSIWALPPGVEAHITFLTMANSV
jgi:N-acetylneuraminic acid mutarotase